MGLSIYKMALVTWMRPTCVCVSVYMLGPMKNEDVWQKLKDKAQSGLVGYGKYTSVDRMR